MMKKYKSEKNYGYDAYGAQVNTPTALYAIVHTNYCVQLAGKPMASTYEDKYQLTEGTCGDEFPKRISLVE